MLTILKFIMSCVGFNSWHYKGHELISETVITLAVYSWLIYNIIILLTALVIVNIPLPGLYVVTHECISTPYSPGRGAGLYP